MGDGVGPEDRDIGERTDGNLDRLDGRSGAPARVYCRSKASADLCPTQQHSPAKVVCYRSEILLYGRGELPGRSQNLARGE